MYPIGALVVTLNLSDNTQTYFGGAQYTKEQPKYVENWPCHQDDVTDFFCNYNAGKGVACSGETGAKSTIHVWDTETQKSLNQFSLGSTAKGVASLALSPCQRYVAACD